MNKPVSFELSKMLKEKSYPLSNTGYGYNNDGNLADPCFSNIICEAPAIADVVMWLYEKHGIWVLVDWSQTKWCFSIIDIKEETVKKVSGERWKERSSGVYLKTLLDFNSPTEAYEAAIEYCLTKLI